MKKRTTPAYKIIVRRHPSGLHTSSLYSYRNGQVVMADETHVKRSHAIEKAQTVHDEISRRNGRKSSIQCAICHRITCGIPVIIEC